MIRTDRRPDGVAVLTLDQPGSKANVLTTEMWHALDAALEEVSDARGVVIASAKPGIFIAGADLKLLAEASGPNDPAVAEFIHLGLWVLNRLATMPCPTCAAIDGAALGGGFEVALACDAWIVSDRPGLKVGLPETTLGLIPGWGGTQRLARALWPAKAIKHLIVGKPVSPGELFPSVKPVSPEAIVEAACEKVAELARHVELLRRMPSGIPSENDPWIAYQADATLPIFRAEAEAMPTPGLTARLAAIDVVHRGYSRPLAEGIAIETKAFMVLAGSDVSKQLIAAFFASRKRG